MIKHEPDTYGWEFYQIVDMQSDHDQAKDLFDLGLAGPEEPYVVLVFWPNSQPIVVYHIPDPERAGQYRASEMVIPGKRPFAFGFATPGERKKFIDQLRVERLVETVANRSEWLQDWRRYLSNKKVG